MPVVEKPPREADPRESEEWFLRLPEKKRRDLLAHWEGGAIHDERWRARQRVRLQKTMLESGLLMLVPLAAVNSLSMLPKVAFFGFWFGAATGAVMHWREGGRFAGALFGAIGFALAQSIIVAPMSFGLLFGGVLAGKVFAGYGMVREARMFDD